jgi:hypothetical protein
MRSSTFGEAYIMTRDELLQLASQCQFSQGVSLAIANDVRTSADIERALATFSDRKAKAHRRQKAYFRFAVAALVVGVGTVFSCALEFVSLTGPTAAVLAAGIVAALVAAVVGQAIASATVDDMVELAKKFDPVVNSSNCKSALEYVQAGKPAVLAWRDLAIAEREVLRVFDVMVMRDLHFASIEAEKDAAQQRENEEACRQLYGVGPSQAPAE